MFVNSVFILIWQLIYNFCLGLFLDGITSAPGVGGRLPAYAFGHDTAGRRRPPAYR